MIRGHVTVFLKDDVMDPQGTAIAQALGALGYTEVRNVRVGRSFDVYLDAEDSEETRERLKAMADKLLANTVVERYQVEILPVSRATAGGKA